MKKILIISLLTISIKADAQFLNDNPLYFSYEIHSGNYFGPGWGMEYILKNKYSIHFGITGGERPSKNEPDDFTYGYFRLFFIPIPDRAYDQVEVIHVMFGRIIELKGKGRLNLGLGLGRATLRESVNWEYRGPKYSTNYSWDYESDQLAAFILKPKYEHPFNNVFGLSVSAQLIVTKSETIIGGGVGLMVGRLNKKNPD